MVGVADDELSGREAFAMKPVNFAMFVNGEWFVVLFGRIVCSLAS